MITSSAPGIVSKIHSMEQNDGPAVRGACGWDIHVGHTDVLAVQRQRQIRYWIRVGDGRDRVRPETRGQEPEPPHGDLSMARPESTQPLSVGTISARLDRIPAT